jgi:hypothetical protein
LEIELKNIILRRVSIFEFLHRQGHFSDLGARSCEVRFTLKNRRRQPGMSGPKGAKIGPWLISASWRATPFKS